MKTLFSLVPLFIASSLLLSAKPTLHINTPTLTPSTTFKLSFKKAVVGPEQVGSSVPNSLLQIEPPLAGNLTWVSPTVAHFERTAVPHIDTTYQLSLMGGLARCLREQGYPLS